MPRERIQRAVGNSWVFALLLACVPTAAGQGELKPLFVEGYASQVSYRPEDEFALHASTSAAKFTVEIARWGASRETVFTKTDVPGVERLGVSPAEERNKSAEPSISLFRSMDFPVRVRRVRSVRRAVGGKPVEGNKSAECGVRNEETRFVRCYRANRQTVFAPQNGSHVRSGSTRSQISNLKFEI